jgi:SOS response regulatory protein OraA/RecX
LASSRAFLDGLALLAGRELSELQLRRRLTKKRHTPADIDEAIARLKREHMLDDERAAAAVARAEASRKGRGRLRVRQAIERAGIGRETARRATDAAFAGIDEDVHLDAAIDRQLRRRTLDDEAQFRRIYRALVTQGFEPGRVLAALRSRQRG